jgi:glucose-1-phosphate adenylyltransferase
LKNLTAMVLAGGRGTRMDMLCRSRAKPALAFAGSSRVIDFAIGNCVNSAIRDISVLVDFQRRSLQDYLGRSRFTEQSLCELRVLEPQRNSYLGTADAVYQNLGLIQRVGADATLILAGDHVYRMDYREMLDFHERAHADVTIGVVSVPLSEAGRFGTVRTDSASRIIEFIEKPRVPQSNLVSMGIYLFNRDVLVRKLNEDASAGQSSHDFGMSIVPGMISRDRVFAYRFSGYWQDIGTVESYMQANLELTRESPAFCLDGCWPMDVRPEHPIVQAGGIVRNSIVAPGCQIKGFVENSVLSPGVHVEDQAVVRDSVLMAGAHVGWHSVVDHCILDEDVSIGRSCYLGFGAGPSKGSPTTTVLGTGVRVPDFTAIDRNCKIEPFSGPADFKGGATRGVISLVR